MLEQNILTYLMCHNSMVRAGDAQGDNQGVQYDDVKEINLFNPFLKLFLCILYFLRQWWNVIKWMSWLGKGQAGSGCLMFFV